jgi:predicted metal-binding protein
VERNRTPLGELRQVAEETLNNAENASVPLRKTGCLGPCSEGHVMGIADEGEGVYLFKEMNEPDSVEELARCAAHAGETGQLEVSPNLKTHLEAKLSPASIPEIPFED